MLPNIIANGCGLPPSIEAAPAKCSFAVTVNDDSSASNADDPPDEVVPLSVPEDDEPEVADIAPPTFDPDNQPDITATPQTPVAEEPAFINMLPSTSFNPVVKPADSVIDPSLPL